MNKEEQLKELNRLLFVAFENIETNNFYASQLEERIGTIQQTSETIGSIKGLKKQYQERGFEAILPFKATIGNVFDIGEDLSEDDWMKSLSDVIDVSNETLMDVEDKAWTDLLAVVKSAINEVQAKIQLLRKQHEVVYEDISEVEECDFVKGKIFGQSKIGFEVTLEMLDTTLSDIIVILDNVRNRKCIHEAVKVLTLKMAKFGFVPITIPGVDGGNRQAGLGYDPIKTGLDAPKKSSIKEKGFDFQDIDPMIKCIINIADERWNLRKARWWKGILEETPKEVNDLLRGDLGEIVEGDDGAMFMSCVNVWLNVCSASISQMLAFCRVIDEIR